MILLKLRLIVIVLWLLLKYLVIYYFNPDFEKGLEDCTKAVGINKSYTKAYYRRAVCNIGLNKYREAFDDLLIVLNDSPDSQEVTNEISDLKNKWKGYIGPIEFNKIESQVEEEILQAKKPENKQKLINKIDSGFKKIQIIEETIEDPNIAPKELVDKYMAFAKTGPEIKKQIDDFVENLKFDEAINLATEKLKISQNFMREFNNKSKYYSQLDIIVNDINNLIEYVKTQKAKDLKEKAEVNNTADNKKYFKTKILNEEVRENATKIAETEIDFNDFPKSAYGFEKAHNSLKNRSDVFYKFLEYFGSENIENIYKNSEISYTILSGVINCLKENGMR
jgi:hypothetical protein